MIFWKISTYVLSAILLCGVISYLIYRLFFKASYHEKLAAKEKEYNQKIQEIERDFNNKKQKALKSYIDASAELNVKFNEEQNKIIEENQKLQIRKTKELNDYVKEQEEIITSHILSYKGKVLTEVEAEIALSLGKKFLEEKSKLKTIQERFHSAAEEIENNLEDLKRKENAAILARIREYEEQNKENFYKIQLSSADIAEIEELEEIFIKIRNPQPLKKAIFDIYYKNPIKDLINRQTMGKQITGIYKITNIKNGKCYIGQSVDIGKRWLQHCKRGSGVDEPTNNKLYPEMMKHKIYNFKFEIVEETSKEKLSEREKYWAKYFGAKIFGYSIKN